MPFCGIFLTHYFCKYFINLIFHVLHFFKVMYFCYIASIITHTNERNKIAFEKDFKKYSGIMKVLRYRIPNLAVKKQVLEILRAVS